jgi:DDE superfamily endonuclease
MFIMLLEDLGGEMYTYDKLQIVWPDAATHTAIGANNNTPHFIATVDGIHCRINEPRHPVYSKNPKFYSHKFHEAALNYELAVSVTESRLLWVNGPFPAAVGDLTVFRRDLKAKVPPGGKLIGDKGYRGEDVRHIISTPRSSDPRELRKFKSRARSRHERFNGMVKSFDCIAERFRHGIHCHKIVFEAVCVICQYQVELVSPLFDVLI